MSNVKTTEVKEELPVAVRKLLHEREVEQWKALRYQLQLRARVARGLKESDTEMIKELQRCEQALDILNSINEEAE